jgi:glycosyltransferase involved in cell wall biosynthesis
VSVKTVGNVIQLFYPTYPYKHKNIKFIEGLIPVLNKYNAKIILTINEEDLPFDSNNSDRVDCIGEVSKSEVEEILKKSDALLFLSSKESLGIPLIEAAYNRIPIIAPKLKYVDAVISNYYSMPDLTVGDFENAVIDLIKESASANPRYPLIKINIDEKRFSEMLIGQ